MKYLLSYEFKALSNYKFTRLIQSMQTFFVFSVMQALGLIRRFYAGFFFANFLITLSCLGLLIYYGEKAHFILSVLIWYKVVTMIAILGMVLNHKKKELYYYQNLGVSRLKLSLTTSTADLILFFMIFLTTYHFL
jgi:hypothetical protein